VDPRIAREVWGGTMNRLRTALRTFVLASCFAVGPAFAQPNGPWLTDEQYRSLSSLRSYEQLLAAIDSAVQSSQGTAVLGWGKYKSNTGRGIPYVRVGNGPTAIIIAAQQHADEMETSDSVVSLIRYASGSSAEAKVLREKLTMVFVPRMNPDGFDGVNPDGTSIQALNGATPPWRQNYDPRYGEGATLPAFYLRGRGYDINRYHPFRPGCPLDNPNYPNINTAEGVSTCETEDFVPGVNSPYDIALGNPVPEAKTVRALFDQFKPAVIMDFHHQGTLVDADGRMITASTLWPTAVATADWLVETDAEPEARARFDSGQLMAKKVVSVLVDAIQTYGYANVSRYPGGTEPGISRNAYGLLGSGSVLLELRGGIGIKSGGYIQKIGYQVGMAVLNELAKSATLEHISTATAESLVVGTGIGNPRIGETEAPSAAGIVGGMAITPEAEAEDDPQHAHN
jgi:hypothetical protein